MKFSRFIVLASAFLLLFGCTEKEQKEEAYEYTKFVSNCSFPTHIKAARGDSYRITGQGFEDGDTFLFEADGNSSVSVPVTNISYSECSFTIVDDLASSVSYNVSILRGKKLQKLGKTTFLISDPALDYNVYGKVTADGKGVKGVYVTDGFGWATTDADGHYELLSEKYYGYVYIVTPSGYENSSATVTFPEFWQAMKNQMPSVAEEHDFELTAVDQSKYSFLMSADWQFRNALSPKDVVQAESYKAEMNSYVSSSSDPVYTMLMGDQTWDLYWYDRSFGEPEFHDYVSDMTCPVYTVIGNHDYDFKASGATADYDGSSKYRATFGPTYYSMDIGAVHYIVVDDITFESDGTGNRTTIETIDDDQLNWLKEDLSHVSMDTPIIVGTHVPMHSWYWTGSKWTASERGNNYNDFLAMLKSYSKVMIYSGHSHYAEYFDAANEKLATNELIERKLPALGGTLWISGTFFDYNIAIDGCPAGYDIVTIDGKNIEAHYKPVGGSTDYRMRVYDTNSVKAYWESNQTIQKLIDFDSSFSFSNLYSSLPANAVLLNVFEADPHMRTMKVEVTEDGNPLDVKYAIVKDPLHIVTTEAAYFNKNNKAAGTSYQANTSAHMFYVVPSSPTSKLEVKLTDRYGNTKTTTIELPKTFTNANIQ